MKESQQIEQQIEALKTRREGVALQATEAEQRLSQARNNVLAGDETAAADISATQANCNALSGLLSEADSQLADLNLKLEEARAEEERATRARRVRELNRQRKTNAEAYDERLAALDSYLSTHIAGLVTELERDAELGREIIALGGVSDVQAIGNRRWSDSGLKHAAHVAQMIGETEREERRQRLKVNLGSTKAA